MTVDREDLRRLSNGVTRLGPPPRMDVACRLAAAVPSLLDEIDAADRRIAELEAELLRWKSPCVDVESEPRGWVCPTCNDPNCGIV